jgi:ribonucleoside-diphosphate reductase alpha chain
MACIAEAARLSSEELGRERGVFPHWSESIYAKGGRRVRNATRTAIAPTGTIGIVADTSPGIEPLFALAYRRMQVLGGQVLEEVNPLLGAQLQARGLDEGRILSAVVARGTLEVRRECQGDQRLRHCLRSARATPEPGGVPALVDNAVSKTVNLRRMLLAAIAVYRRAWQLAQGCHVHRYGASEPGTGFGTADEAYHYDHLAKCDPTECRL